MRKKTTMRHIREALRLVYQQGLSRNQAGQALGIGRTTLQELDRRFQSSGMPLEEALHLSDTDLESHLFPASVKEPSRPGIERRILIRSARS